MYRADQRKPCVSKSGGGQSCAAVGHLLDPAKSLCPLHPLCFHRIRRSSWPILSSILTYLNPARNLSSINTCNVLISARCGCVKLMSRGLHARILYSRAVRKESCVLSFRILPQLLSLSAIMPLHVAAHITFQIINDESSHAISFACLHRPTSEF